MKPEPLFYIEREEGKSGLYDLVQMAGFLRKKIITEETLTCREGNDDWKPFCEHPQFIVAREMPPSATSKRTIELAEKEQAGDSPIPLPSAETLMKLGGMAVGALLAGGVAFLLAWLDPTLGYCLLAIGVGSMMVAQCLTVARLLDEDWLTLLFVFFVPFGDIFYFISNIWAYFTWFCMKYVGLAVIIGAGLGLGLAAHSHH